MSSGLAGYVRRTLKKGPIQPLLERWRPLRMARPEKYGGSYLKEAWAEIPELLIASLYGVAAFCMVGHLYYKEQTEQYFSNRPYKFYYCVMRPDDPRVVDASDPHHVRNEFYDRK